MRFFEVDSAVDAIMSAAMIAQNRASQRDKQGKLSMNGFLQMLANAGVVVDYEGFKTVFDTNPQLANVIAKFDKDSITFASADAEDEGAGYEEPQTDMPDDERVAKMAQRATKMRTREFVETTLTEFDRHQDIIDQIVDMQPETSNEIIRMAQKLGAPDRAIDDILQAVLDRVNIDEAELPPHLAKMFGKDGKQVDTRTDVMKQMRDIVANKQASKVEFGDGEQMVDMYTASVLTQIYDKVNDNSKEAIIQRIGTIEKFTKLMPTLFNMISKNESVSESVKENAKQRLDEFAPLAALAAGAVRLGAAALRTGGMAAARGLANAAAGAVRLGAAAALSGDSDSSSSSSNAVELGKQLAQATEGHSPHKKGTKKYKAHMAAMHAGESVDEAWQAFKERSLTKAEKRKMKHYEKKLPKQDFIDRYGKEQGEAIYYATATKMAKKNA